MWLCCVLNTRRCDTDISFQNLLTDCVFIIISTMDLNCKSWNTAGSVSHNCLKKYVVICLSVLDQTRTRYNKLTFQLFFIHFLWKIHINITFCVSTQRYQISNTYQVSTSYYIEKNNLSSFRQALQASKTMFEPLVWL